MLPSAYMSMAKGG